MSIHNKRLEQLTHKILKKEIQKGNLPTSKEFIWKLNQALQDQELHMPSYKFKAYRNTEIIQAGRINQDNDAIHEDFTILYDNIIDVHKLLNKYQSNFEVEKEKIQNEISTVQNEIKQKLQTYNKGGYLAYAYDCFDDLSKVDTDTSKDIFVDTKEKQVRLVEEKNTSARIFPTPTPTFTFLETGADKLDTTISGNLADLFNDDIDTVWQRMVRLKQNQTLTGQLIIQLDKAYGINKIDIDLMTIKKFFAKIEFTPDGSTWYDLPYNETKKEIENYFSVQFPMMKIKAFRVLLEKTEADEVKPIDDGYDYRYLFGIKSIRLYNKQYPSYGLFQSKILDLHKAPENYRVDTVRLSVDESTPTGSSITYEIALPRKDGVLDWHRIDPMERVNPSEKQAIQFSNIKKDEALSMFFPEEFSITQSEAEDLLSNGIPIYRLSTLNGDKNELFIAKKAIIDGTMRLYSGRNTWEITSFPSEDVTGIPSLDDWKTVRDDTIIRYSPMTNTKSGEVITNWTGAKKSKYMCRAGFYHSGEDQIITTTPVSTDPIALYVNGERVYEGETEANKSVNISIKNGWNELAVLINGINTTSVNGITMALGFNPQAICEYCYASMKPLTHVPLFDLQYNTKQNDRSVFSSRQTENGIEILTNFAQEGLKFDFYFDYADEIAMEEEAKILLRAHLNRDNGEDIPSPTITSYRLEFS
ncbi:hypothetical protein I4L69_001641 [Enterococcus faecium]|nr:hypothetical protein [Enterococcus faecium]